MKKVDQHWMRGAFAACLISVTFLTGCLKEDDVYDANQYFQQDIQTLQTYLTGNGINAQYDSSGVYYQVHDEGDGYMPYYGGKVRVRFQGFTLDGTKFVDTFGETNPREFVLGQGNEGGATAGLNIGIHALQVGDSATIYVPSPLGYQNQSVGNNVPANSILVYNVKFEAIKNLESELVKIDEYIEDKSFNAEIDERYGTRYVIHKSGSGPTPVYNQSITTHYILQSLGGNEYDNSYKRTPPTPFQFRYATGQVIPGFHMGFENLQQGDSATFFVPSTYGYREAGQGDIPPNAVLVFGVRVENFGGLQ